jgi:hypothetical protein
MLSSNAKSATKTAGLAAFLSLAGCACWPLRPASTARVKEGDQYCTVVHIPRPWSIVPMDAVVAHGLYRNVSPSDGFLFSIDDPSSTTPSEHPDRERYWIGLTHRGQIRPATADEWEHSQAIGVWNRSGALKLQGPELPNHPVETDPRILMLNGRALPKSGDIWVGFAESPQTSYVSLSSFNGWWDAGRAAHDGPFFIDVYGTTSGKRIALIRGSWCDYTPDGVLNELRWISDRDLVFPYGSEKRDIVVCHFD